MYERIYCKEQLDALPNDAMLGEVYAGWAPSLCLGSWINIYRKGSVTEGALLRRLDGKPMKYLVIPKW